jgi:hypothetical protein
LIRVAKAVLIGSVTLMRQTPHNPTDLPIAVFDGIWVTAHVDRSQLFQDLTEDLQ